MQETVREGYNAKSTSNTDEYSSAQSDDIQGHIQGNDWETKYHPFLEDDLPTQLSPRGLRRRPLQLYFPFENYEEDLVRNKGGRGVKKMASKKRGQWSNGALKAAFQALDNGYKMKDFCQKYGIPRSSLRDHYLSKIKSRKLGAAVLFIKDEEVELVQYLKDMVKISCPLTTIQLRLKVGEIIQARMTPFTNGVSGKS